MAFRSLSSLVPTADELLSLDVGALGVILLTHLKNYEGGGGSVHQNGLYSQSNFLGMQGLRSYGQKLEYGERQAEVNRALMEAWSWLEREGILIRDPTQPAPWFSISRSGEELLSRNARFEGWEKLGVDRIKHDLLNGGFRVVGGPAENQELAWEWVRMKEGKTALPAGKRAGSQGLPLIADERLNELRKLCSSEFDFRKLIRLCEELNAAYNDGCYFAVAMLTRGLVDHVPPLFGKSSFAEVANNYAGGGKSFKDTIQHLENAARKVGDAHLHMPIRNSESLPTAQQVCFAPQLDVLLAEIVRILK
jgi:hypothetical protein